MDKSVRLGYVAENNYSGRFMSDFPVSGTPDLLVLTAQIVSAHVTANKVPAEALPNLIAKVHGALAGAGAVPAPEPAPVQQQPAVPVRKSIQPDYLVCLEDGVRVTMLKRYLQRRFGLTPDQYRAKWGLPADYPMVAPSYAVRRSTLAKELGLGRKRSAPEGASHTPDGSGKAAAADTPEDRVSPADVADRTDAGRHTAESVFSKFGKDGAPDTENAGKEGDLGPTAAAPRKRGRKPFAEQSMRAIRSRRTPVAG